MGPPLSSSRSVFGRRCFRAERAAVANCGPIWKCIETTVLVQARLGMDAVRALFDDLLPVVTVVAIDEAHHTNVVATLFGVNRRDLSLVDCSSFAMMRQRGIAAAFAFDRRFAQQGFRLIAYTADG